VDEISQLFCSFLALGPVKDYKGGNRVGSKEREKNSQSRSESFQRRVKGPFESC
jgi:hypothetical protein